MHLKNKERLRKYLVVILWTIFVLNLVIGIIYGVHYYYQLYQNNKFYEDIRETVISKEDKSSDQDSLQNSTKQERESQVEHSDDKKDDEKQSNENNKEDIVTEDNMNDNIQLDFMELNKINEDIYGYIIIPGTDINYPILQHSTDDSYYLTHNIDHSKGYPGTIYSEKYNSKDFSDNVTILYGHNMKNGTMFGGLHQFKDSDFLDKNRYLYIFTKDKAFKYEIIMASEYGNRHILKSFDFDNEEERNGFIKSVVKKAGTEIEEKLIDGFQDNILILSTCSKYKSTNRYIVIAKLMDNE